MGRRHERDPVHGIFWGLVFIGIGVVFLLSQQGILPARWFETWWDWWPALLVAWGLVRLIRPRDASDVGGGVTLTLIGLWLLANSFDWWGLTWRTSWPIALMAVGAGMMARAAASSVMRDCTDPVTFDPRKETPHVE